MYFTLASWVLSFELTTQTIAKGNTQMSKSEIEKQHVPWKPKIREPKYCTQRKLKSRHSVCHQPGKLKVQTSMKYKTKVQKLNQCHNLSLQFFATGHVFIRWTTLIFGRKIYFVSLCFLFASETRLKQTFWKKEWIFHRTALKVLSCEETPRSFVFEPKQYLKWTATFNDYFN